MVVLAPLEGPNARLSAEAFDAMCAEGAFGDVHVELLGEGEIRVKVGQGPFHMYALMLLDDALGDLPRRAGLRSVFGATVSLGTMRPEPDFALVRLDPRRRPRPIFAEDVLFVAEVSVTSLATDRLAKTAIYAEAGIAEYWIVNPMARQIEVYRRPGEGGYGSLRVAGEGETLDLLSLPSVLIAVDDLLPFVSEG